MARLLASLFLLVSSLLFVAGQDQQALVFGLSGIPNLRFLARRDPPDSEYLTEILPRMYTVLSWLP